jgi:hypothetical protein
MSKRVSAEEKILNYFESASIPEAKVLLNVVIARMKQREAAIAPAVAAKKPVVKARAPRRTKAQMAAAATASAPTTDQVAA